MHARSWRELAKCRFAHFPPFFSVHVDTYEKGAIQVLRNADGVGGGGVRFSGKKCYKGVMFNVISVTRG